VNSVKVHYRPLELTVSVDVCVTQNAHSWVVIYNTAKQSEIRNTCTNWPVTLLYCQDWTSPLLRLVFFLAPFRRLLAMTVIYVTCIWEFRPRTTRIFVTSSRSKTFDLREEIQHSPWDIVIAACDIHRVKSVTL
jgi:hypothetical protein